MNTRYLFLVTDQGPTRNLRLFFALLLWAGVLAWLTPGASNAQTSPVTFTYTGATQIFTVPAGVTTLRVVANGAQGGGDRAGKGGRVTATLTVTPGQLLILYVGGQNGHNGGGAGSGSGSNGGGATDIRISNTALGNRVIVAGGGGGSGGTSSGAFGGAGGGLIGGAGPVSGSGGSQSAGGLGGGEGAGSGAAGVGGPGASSRGGGGGGGYFGGGGGFSVSGGGGSSYPDPANLPLSSGGVTVTNIVHEQGVNTGDGSITISWGEPGAVVCITSSDPNVSGTFEETTLPAYSRALLNTDLNALLALVPPDHPLPRKWYIFDEESNIIFSNPSTDLTIPLTGWVATNGGTITITNGACAAACTPTVSIAASPTGSITTGTSVTFTATPVNGGTMPAYVWKKNDAVISGESSATYTTTTLADGDKIKVEMTSNAACASPALATSNEITMTVTNPCPQGGEIWTARMAAEANSWSSVTYGNGLFVAVSQDGTNRVMTSPDGITWTARTPAEVNSWQSVTYGNGVFVALAWSGTNRVMTSPDGITWTARMAAEANNWNSVKYGNGLFVAVSQDGTNRVMTSPDGITWTARTAAEANQWLSVTYGNGLFVAVANSGTNRVMTSPDGITWTARTAAEENRWQSVTYGNGLFVAVALSGTNRVMTSPDGITWTARTAAEANGWYSVTYGNSLFVAVAIFGTNRVMTSPDGITWTARTAEEANGWRSVTYGNGLFVAVAQSGTNRVMTSPAGGSTPSVSITANPTGSITTGTSVTFTATPVNGGTTPTYVWKKNDSVIPNEAGATYTTNTLANGDKIKVVMTSNDPCASPTTATSNELTMTVTIPCSQPTANIGVPSGAKCEGQPITLNASGGATYSWAFSAGGSFTSTTGSPATWTPSAGGSYNISLTANNGTCTASTSTSIVVSSKPTASINRSSNTVCAGLSITLSNQATQPTSIANAPPPSAGVSWAASGGSFSSTSSSPTNWSANAAGSYNISLTVNDGSCSNTASTTVSVNATPTASIAVPSGVKCEGQPITLNASGGTTYSWAFSAGGSFTSTTGSPATWTPNAGGTYTVSLTVNNGTCTASTSTSIVVSSKPTASINRSSNTVCAGVSITLSNQSVAITPNTANVANIPPNFSWAVSPGGSFTSTTGSPVTWSSNTTGSYSVTLTVNNGSCSNTASTTVSVNALPSVLTVTGGGEVCPGTSVTVGLASSMSGVMYQLKSGNNNVGGSVPGDGTAISFGNISTAGTYTVVATNSNNCTATMNGSATVTVPNPVGGTASADQNICSGTTPTNNLSLSGNVGNVTKWQRATNANFTGATDISVATTTLTSSTIGNLSTDTWFRAVVQAGTCAPVNSSAVKITILQPHTASINATTIVCTGNAIGLTASPNESGLTYAWSGPGNFSSTLRTPSRPNATLAMSGVYRLTVASPACGFSSTASVSVIATTPNGKAAPRLRALLINGTVAGLGNVYSVCSGAPVTATIAAISGTSYSWNGPNGTSGVGSLAVTAPPATISAAANANTAGNYTMTIFNGCDRSTTVNFSISLRNCTSTRLASAEGDGSMGLSLEVAPNPVRDVLSASVQGITGDELRLNLIDAQGRSLQQASIEAAEGKAQHRFDVRSLPAGMYLLQAETDTQRATKKVIKL